MGYIDEIKQKTGVNPFILIGGVLASILLVFYGQSEKYVTALTGIIYPCYMSLKAIDSPDEDDDKQWCTYWVVFFLFILLELYLSYFLHKIPFYFLMKLIFLIWLFFPLTQGACFLYEKFLKKVYAKYEKELDSLVDSVGESVSRGYSDAKKKLKDQQGNIISGAANIASQVASSS
jgi:receptor expression-enhancing protein 5/6